MHRRGRTLAGAGAVAATATVLGSALAGADPGMSMPGDGLYRVGIDIVPGIYQAPGAPDAATGCFWQRLWHVADPGDETDPNHYVVASDFTRTTPVRVLVKPSDAAFRSSGCGDWTLMPAPPASGSSGPGTPYGSEF
ncbi:hypothetical protein [Nocardia sp. alder85J]|uniref:hypothetical protein n=1 Tax=Nocardia sp. alder85J TaxID=2862949 RepID=UPI001CD7DFBA|nr:hypothetical protein [Nocardia sp. alder85J]MCX4095366.1 hypothetical protein [Nocardia sp. alder85J]